MYKSPYLIGLRLLSGPLAKNLSKIEKNTQFCSSKAVSRILSFRVQAMLKSLRNYSVWQMQIEREAVTLIVVCTVQSCHSQIDYAITMLSRPTLTVSISLYHTSVTNGGAPHTSKMARNRAQTTRFSLVHLQRELRGEVFHI